MMNTIQMYDAQADSINVDDIATNDNNRIILRRFKRNNPEDHDVLYIQNQHDEDGEACEDYVPEDTNDMGWLGYFIGKNDHLETLYLRDFDNMSVDIIKPFFMGISRNKSITHLDIYETDLLGGRMFTMLVPFFESSPTLAYLKIHDCHLGDDGWRSLALAIGSSKNKSLQDVSLINSNISDEGLVDIITALSIHPRLEKLDLDGNRLNKHGCIAMATLLKCSVTKIETLDLRSNELDDESIHSLVPGLKSCNHLQTIILLGNLSITKRGWQHLASVLKTPNSNLESLRMENNNVDDETLTAFANALLNNKTLTSLSLNDNQAITEKGWQSLSNLLCDTSSINSTYLSNHTLSYLGNISNENPLQSLLELNEREYEDEIAMIKIIQNHNDFDMTPFFEWEFKVLPLMINWFERASRIPMPEDYEPDIGPRKLSSIYQFVRAMPLLYVETRLRKELEDIKVLETKYQLAQERKRSIMDRLDQRL